MYDNEKMSRRIAEKVHAAGGHTYLVGGIVRDRLMGRENKDIDLEIHGITPERLHEILSELGEVTVMGSSFGVFGLKHYDLDIAMPRKEEAIGRGHKDFAVDVDPFLGTRAAAIRRDFTINAMMQDVLTDELIDHFGGRKDLDAGIIRHVCDESFGEDPLRVLRAAQFAARFGFSVAEETVEICSRMDLTALPRERIFTELEKALRKAPTPSVFFTVLREMEQLQGWFFHLRALIGKPCQTPGMDCFAQTMQRLDAAAKRREKAKEPLFFLLGALCACMEPGDAAAFLETLTAEVRLTRYVLNTVELLPLISKALASDTSDPLPFLRLFDQAVSPEDLLLLLSVTGISDEADRKGQALLSEYRRRMDAPGVMGRDLAAAGFQPSPRFKEALTRTHEWQLMGIGREEALRRAVDFLNTQPKGGDKA